MSSVSSPFYVVTLEFRGVSYYYAEVHPTWESAWKAQNGLHSKVRERGYYLMPVALDLLIGEQRFRIDVAYIHDNSEL